MNRGEALLAAAVLSLLPLLAGCSATPAARAQEKAAAFGRLSPADQRLVLSGNVRPGLDRTAVYIAWGGPSQTQAAGPAEGPWDAWLYTHTFYGVDSGYFGARRGWVYSAQAGRYFYSADDFYESPVYIKPFGKPSTDVPYRHAWFDGATLVHFESTAQSETPAGAEHAHRAARR